MSEEIKNGDMPAMPTIYCDFSNGNGEFFCDQQGLTKREMIAMHIIGSIAASSPSYVQKDRQEREYSYCAEKAVAFADALIKELG